MMEPKSMSLVGRASAALMLALQERLRFVPARTAKTVTISAKRQKVKKMKEGLEEILKEDKGGMDHHMSQTLPGNSNIA